MPKLGVNIDHVATLRQARRGVFPSVLEAARVCQAAGADSIVAHLREDRRHIQDADLWQLKRNLNIRLNLEMSLAKDILRIATVLKPHQATFVPEKRVELTTEGGLDVVAQSGRITCACEKLNNCGVRVSLFIDPDPRQIKAACACGVKIIEIHTGAYAQARSGIKIKKELAKIRKAVTLAAGYGLEVNVGHGLDYTNVAAVAQIKKIHEFNIGYAVICQALFTGLNRAVKQMKGLIR